MDTPPTSGGQPPGQSRPPAGPPGGAPPSRVIQHPTTTLRPSAPKPVSLEPEPVPVVEAAGPSRAPKITAFGKAKKHEEEWIRTPNTTGTGAIHVKTFHCKLTDDALRYMDQCVNEWLDAHPQYEVKFVTSTIGTLTGKLKEPNLVCQIWV